MIRLYLMLGNDYFFAVLLVLVLLCKLEGYNQSLPYKLVKVTTSLGQIVGKEIEGIRYFLGIPFAEPPLGRYRFHPPIPKRPWFPTTYHAFNFSFECLQSQLHSPDGGPRDEDCLYLNVWQPSHCKPGALLPVLFWIYGGGFLHGASSRPYYWGDKLARRDVVVVSCNYRVGALGFLVSTNDGLFGNYGLHDQKLALEWVQDNIRNFNGDPNRVTVFGESAGAMSVGLHFLEQQHHRGLQRARRKLFHQIILQSNPLGYKYRTVAVANFIGEAYKEQLDCDDLRCLQSEPPDELIHVQDTLIAMPRAIGDFFTWGPVITDNSYYRESRLKRAALSDVIVKQPLEAVRLLKRVNVPIIIGATADEGTLFVFSAFHRRMVKVLFQTLVFSFFRTHAPGVMRTYSALIKSIDDSPYPDYRIALSAIIGDYLFRCPTQLFANILASTSIHAPVYLYEFALPTRTPGFTCCDGLSCHTAEIPYVFNLLDMIVSDYVWRPPHVDINSVLSSSIYEGNLHQNVNSAGNSMFSLPDIFGATKSYTRKKKKFNEAWGDDEWVMTHLQVSEYMSSFWTTFAYYGDPNGQRSNETNHGYVLKDHRLGHSKGSQPPFWPQLLGMQSEFGKRLDDDMNETATLALENSKKIGRFFAKQSPSELVDNIYQLPNSKASSITTQSSRSRSAHNEKKWTGKFLDILPHIFISPSDDEDEYIDDVILGSTLDSFTAADTNPQSDSNDWLKFRQGGIAIDFRHILQPFINKVREHIKGIQPSDSIESQENEAHHHSKEFDGTIIDSSMNSDGLENENIVETDNIDQAQTLHNEPASPSDRQLHQNLFQNLSGGRKHEHSPEADKDVAYESNGPEILSSQKSRKEDADIDRRKSKSTSKATVELLLPVFDNDVHSMSFDESTDVAIISSDCMCKFWNSLEYKF